MEKKLKEKHNEDFNLFTCSCGNDGDEPLTFEQFKKHLINVHGIDTKAQKMSKKMTMHLDGEDYFLTTYECKILPDGPTFYQSIRLTIAMDDPMRFH